MNRDEAYLILRCLVSLFEEGIGPDHAFGYDKDRKIRDEQIIQEAIVVAGDRISAWARWWD